MDYEEIVERIKRVVDTPAKPIPEEALTRERERFYQLHDKSLKLFEEAKSYIPGGSSTTWPPASRFPWPWTGSRDTVCGTSTITSSSTT